MAFAGDRGGGKFQVSHATEDDLGIGDCRLGRVSETG